jgi:2-dehydropantoate 2-reductase
VRICLLGAGATGGHFAVKLALSGHEVSVIARGAHLEAIASNGLTLISADRRLEAKVRASDTTTELGPQDLVIVAVKATGLSGVVDLLAPLVGPETLVAFPQNGVGWWYPIELPGACPAPPDIPIFGLARAFMRVLKTRQILAGSIYSANEVLSPGVILNGSPDRNAVMIGSIDHCSSVKVAGLRQALETAGISSPAVEDIRQVMWSKLVVNLSSSVIALVTENKSSISRTDSALGEIYLRTVNEGLDIARAHGYSLYGKVDPMAMRARLVEHRPSILQDYELRRPMEIGVLVAAPIAFARAAGISTPTLDTLSAIAIRKARDRGLY